MGLGGQTNAEVAAEGERDEPDEHVAVVLVSTSSHMAVVEGEHHEPHRGHARARHQLLPPPRLLFLREGGERLALGALAWEDLVKRHGGQPVEQALEEGDTGRKVLELELTLHEGNGACRHPVDRRALEQGARDRGHKDAGHFQGEGREKEDDDGLFAHADPALVTIGRLQVALKIIEGRQRRTPDEGRGRAEVRQPDGVEGERS